MSVVHEDENQNSMWNVYSVHLKSLADNLVMAEFVVVHGKSEHLYD